MTQKELDRKIKAAETTVSGYEIEHSRPKFETVEKIAHACDFEIEFVDKNSGERISSKYVNKKDRSWAALFEISITRAVILVGK